MVMHRHKDALKDLKVENMNSARPEDKEEILATIPDKESFDLDMQRMLFSGLLPSWKSSDDLEQMHHAPHWLQCPMGSDGRRDAQSNVE